MNDALIVEKIFIRKNEEPGHLAGQLDITKDDAETLLFDIMPVLKRKYVLLNHESASPDEINIMKILLNQEVPKVFSNYALSHLISKKTALVFLIKKISQNIDNQQIKQLISNREKQPVTSLYDQFAVSMGINPTYLKEFKFKVMPTIKKYTMSMCRKKLADKKQVGNFEGFVEFIIDNVFIDEFENYIYVRPATDKNNKAILPPKAKEIAIKMISIWITQIYAEENS